MNKPLFVIYTESKTGVITHRAEDIKIQLKLWKLMYIFHYRANVLEEPVEVAI